MDINRSLNLLEKQSERSKFNLYISIKNN